MNGFWQVTFFSLHQGACQTALDLYLGAAGVAAISPTALIGTLLPLVLGVVLGNLSPFIRGLLVPGINQAQNQQRQCKG